MFFYVSTQPTIVQSLLAISPANVSLWPSRFLLLSSHVNSNALMDLSTRKFKLWTHQKRINLNLIKLYLREFSLGFFSFNLANAFQSILLMILCESFIGSHLETSLSDCFSRKTREALSKSIPSEKSINNFPFFSLCLFCSKKLFLFCFCYRFPFSFIYATIEKVIEWRRKCGIRAGRIFHSLTFIIDWKLLAIAKKSPPDVHNWMDTKKKHHPFSTQKNFFTQNFPTYKVVVGKLPRKAFQSSVFAPETTSHGALGFYGAFKSLLHFNSLY